MPGKPQPSVTEALAEVLFVAAYVAQSCEAYRQELTGADLLKIHKAAQLLGEVGRKYAKK
jgi:hypothetical protein